MTGRAVAILQMVGGKLQAGGAGDGMLRGVNLASDFLPSFFLNL